MEGTRHERSAIITVSYVIGFVSAFILYQAGKDDFFHPAPQQIVIQADQVQQSQSQAASTINSQQNITPTITRTNNSIVTSQDGKYTFTCEVTGGNQNVCTAHIYVANTNTSEVVTMDGIPVTMSTDLISDVSWSGHILNIGEITSSDLDRPWLLSSENLPIDLQ